MPNTDWNFLKPDSEWGGLSNFSGGDPITPMKTPMSFDAQYLNDMPASPGYDFMGMSGGGGKGFQMPTIPTPGADTFKPTFMQQAFGYKDPKTGTDFGGYATPALGLAQGAMKTWLGLKQLGIAEESLSFEKEAFSKQFGAQRTLTNAELESRQRRAADRNIENKDLFSARVA